ncbi:paramyosin-like [Uranotaenia lowii]|uniref:paramyosin-like n=1 Tax=Uranotaenia lowii TaxID=190385 RepID=UPI00247A5659|nr:paramyosin-like [Uranotaenia lowii]
MSYATQRDFFNVTFHNEDPKLPDRKRSDGALMTYEFCSDNRAWALDKEKRSNYILDVVHKTRYKKAMLNPQGDYALSKEYLIQLDVQDLAEYVICLQEEIQRMNQQQGSQSQQPPCAKFGFYSTNSDQLENQARQLQQDRDEFEQQMADLEEVIVDLKERADRYENLARENELLRCQLQSRSSECTDKMKLINAEAQASFNRLRAEDAEKLEAELIIFKAEYEELRQQNLELREHLQRAYTCQTKLAELKRQLTLEQELREKVEDDLEHMLNLYDKQSAELRLKTNYFVGGQALPAIESIAYDKPSTPPPRSQPTSKQDEACMNCENLRQQLAKVQDVHAAELKQKDHLIQELQNKLDVKVDTPVKLDAPVKEDTTGQNDQVGIQLGQCEKELAELKQQLSAAAEQQKALEQQLTAEKEFSANKQKLVEELQTKASVPSPVVVIEESDDPATQQLIELQKQLNDARQQLEAQAKEKNQLAEQNTKLQSQMTQLQDSVRVSEAALKQKDAELADVKAQTTQAATPLPATSSKSDTELLECTKKTESLQTEVDRLRGELATAKGQQKQGVDSADLQSEIENLKQKLQTANDGIAAKEAELKNCNAEIAKMVNVQKEMEKQIALSDSKALEASNALAAQMETIAKEAERKASDEAERKASAEAERKASAEAERKASAEAERKASAEAERKASAEVEKTALEETEAEAETVESDIPQMEEVDESSTVESLPKGSIDEIAEKLPSMEEQITPGVEVLFGIDQMEELGLSEAPEVTARKLSTLQRASDDEDEGVIGEDISAESTETLVPEAEHSGEEEVFAEEEEEVGEGESARKSSEELEAEKLAEAEAIFDSDMITLGHSDMNKTKKIAFKIYRCGIQVLVLGELDHLHREICRAFFERFGILNQSFNVVDQSMCTCTQLLQNLRTMGDNEMMGLLNPGTSIPIRNPMLLEDEIPVKIPAEPKPRTTRPSTSAGVPNDANILYSLFTGMPPPGPSQTNGNGKKTTERVVMDNFPESCRSRPWRAPRTPTETIVARTLADGSRLYARQKRNT